MNWQRIWAWVCCHVGAHRNLDYLGRCPRDIGPKYETCHDCKGLWVFHRYDMQLVRCRVRKDVELIRARVLLERVLP